MISDSAVFGCIVFVFPGCVILERGLRFFGGIDAALCLFGAAEVAIVMALCRSSTGAWVNYAIPGVVFAAIFTASLFRGHASKRTARATLIPIAVAALAVLSFEIRAATSPFTACEPTDSPPSSSRVI